MQSLVLGIDIGTTSISVVAVNESGTQVLSLTQPHRAGVTGLPIGCAEQNPGTLWRAVCSVLREVSDTTPGDSLQALGLTGQMHSTLLLDADMEPAGNIITWQDRRAVAKDAAGQSVYDLLLSQVSADAMEPTGCRLSPGYMGTTIFAMEHLKQLPASPCRASFVADWVSTMLSGQPPVTDRSHATSSGLYDLRNDCWSGQLLAATGIDPNCLPRVVGSGSIIGEVTVHAARQTGLPAGTKICNAIGDNQAAVLSSLPHGPDSLLINIGTGGQIVWRIPAFERVDGLDTRYLPSVSTGPVDTAYDADPWPRRTCQSPSSIGPASQNPPRLFKNYSGGHEFMLVGAGLCGGDDFTWINRTVRAWLQAFGVEKTEEEVWQCLAEQLAGGSDNLPALICEPFFAGTRLEPSRRAVIRDIGTTNFTPANVARSILDGIAETMLRTYQSAGGHRPDVLKEVALSGNGARQNPQLVRAVAERFGVTTQVAPCREEAATGAAMLAGVSIGFWPDLQTAQSKIHQRAS